MLKTGRSVRSDDEFAAYVEHFRRFFLRPLEPAVEVRYIPGNADVDLGVSSPFSKHVRQRYERHFGRANQLLAAANHSLVLLDAPGIVDEDYMRAGSGTSFEEWIPLRDGAIEFIKGLAAEEQSGPAILFSHIPLHRAESKQCGPLRERGTIHRGVGHGWQKDAREADVRVPPRDPAPHDRLQVADDRDYCDVTHSLPGSGREDPRNHSQVLLARAAHLAPRLPPTLAGGHTIARPRPRASVSSRAQAILSRGYTCPRSCLTILILIVTHMRRANHAARLRLTTPASPLPSHADPKQQQPAPAVPSPYSASSAYSYSYAYSNTPPTGSQPRRDRDRAPPRAPRPPPPSTAGAVAVAAAAHAGRRRAGRGWRACTLPLHARPRAAAVFCARHVAGPYGRRSDGRDGPPAARVVVCLCVHVPWAAPALGGAGARVVAATE
ncbi:hypothetical protein EDB83DRAFT_2520365 [Lactarius deliciosus]|nr:hypothetical protein EDB83DRAFT_2520365 [Lactarius deliciosus]